jgi:hypothetical protein
LHWFNVHAKAFPKLEIPGTTGGSGYNWRFRVQLEVPGTTGGSGYNWRFRVQLEVPGTTLCKISRKSLSLTRLLSVTTGKQWNRALKLDVIASFRIQRTPTYIRNFKHSKALNM